MLDTALTYLTGMLLKVALSSISLTLCYIQRWTHILFILKAGPSWSWLDLHLPVQSVIITTKIISSNSFMARCNIYNIM